MTDFFGRGMGQYNWFGRRRGQYNRYKPNPMISKTAKIPTV